MPHTFDGVSDVVAGLASVGYVADEALATVVFLARRLGRPVLVEGPAGVGKTELARAVATMSDARLVRLQCYEGLDESRALYEWNYRRQLLRITAEQGTGDGDTRWHAVEDDLFTEEYLLERPLLHALRAEDDVTLLIDEIDKVDVEFEALLLELLDEFQVTIPELGTIVAARRPFVVLTSNSTRELSEALRRRCLFLYLDHPDRERELAIVRQRVPEAPAAIAEQVVALVASLRRLDLRRPPSVAETLDWVRTLVALGVDTLDGDVARATLGVVLKFRTDIEVADAHLADTRSADADVGDR
ncbi:MAG: MoxR family ATPase [Nitriliruptoraceae bacterium]